MEESATSKTIIHNDTSDVTIAAHAIKALLNIKLSRAKERHASAMGYVSSNHLLAELKNNAVERTFDAYIAVLKEEAMTHHQVTVDARIIDRLHYELLE